MAPARRMDGETEQPQQPEPEERDQQDRQAAHHPLAERAGVPEREAEEESEVNPRRRRGGGGRFVVHQSPGRGRSLLALPPLALADVT